MSGYKTHFTTAAGCALVIIAISHRHTPFLAWFSLVNAWCIVASMLGGLFPDIDIKSKGQQLLYAIIIPLLIATLLAKKVVLSILLSALGIIPPLLPHRGITHHVWFSFLAPLIGPGLVYIYCPEHVELAYDLYFFFVIGALSHLILDYGPATLLRRMLRPLANYLRSRKKRKK